jgi:hypothetical protein
LAVVVVEGVMPRYQVLRLPWKAGATGPADMLLSRLARAMASAHNHGMNVLCAFFLLAASPQVWVEPSTVHVLDGAVRSEAARGRAELFAARGEWESFQVCIVAGDQPLERVTLEAPALPGLPPPLVYRLAYTERAEPSGRSSNPTRFWPDALVPAQPVNLPAKGFATFWVTYRIPEDAKPGRHAGTIKVSTPSRRKAWKLGCRVQVFNFVLPARSVLLLTPVTPRTLAAAFGADRGETIASELYSQLAPFGVGPLLRVDGAPLQPGDIPGIAGQAYGLPVDTPDSAARDGALALEVQANTRLIPGSPLAEDPATLWCGGIHPRAQGRSALWAAPLRNWSPELPLRLRAGQGLQSRKPLAGEAAASATGTTAGDGLPTRAGDACDGSPYSAWFTPEPVPGAPRNWWEVHFDFPRALRNIEIVWVTGHETDQLVVETSYDGVLFSPATVRWNHAPPEDAYGASHSLGTFRYPQQASAFRLTLGPNAAGRALGIAEVRFFPEAEDAAVSPTGVRPQSLWLLADDLGFPSLALDAHPVEARVLPMVVWGHGFGGAVLPPAADLPGAWVQAALAGEVPMLWPAVAQAPLVYPTAAGFAPSARLMRVRDGIEDHAYRVALGTAAAQGRVKNPKLLALIQARPYNPRPGREDLDGIRDALLRQRLAIGRALADKARKEP